MSIFNKICPRCASDNGVDVSHCQCGFVFETSATTGSYRALEMAGQEAQVYAEYLEARLYQAKETSDVAINDQAQHPGDDTKISASKIAHSEYLEAQTEYDEQVRLVQRLQQESANVQAQERKQEESAWDKAKKRTKEKAQKAEQEALAAKKKALAAKQKEDKEIAKKIELLAQQKLLAVKKAKKLQQEKLKAEAAMASNAKAFGQNFPPPKMQEKMASSAEAAAVRARQMRLTTEKDLMAAAAALKANTLAAEPENKPEREAKNGQQVDRLAKTPVLVKKKGLNANEKDCPNCTAVVVISTKECKCGYSFPQGTDLMDGIGLSEEDSADLLNMFQPSSST